MDKPILILDANYIIDIFGRNDFDIALGERILDGLFNSYEVYLPDTIMGELAPNNADHVNSPGLKSLLEGKISSNLINDVTTGIPAGTTDAGDAAIRAILDNPSAYGIDTGSGAYIATRDASYFVSGDGQAYSGNVLPSQELTKSAAIDGRISLEDYKAISTDGSPNIGGGWDPYKSVTVDAVQAKYGLDGSVDGDNFIFEKDGKTVTIPESEMFRGSGSFASDIEHNGTAKTLSHLSKFGSALDKAGWIGDILGTAVAIAEAQAAYGNGDNHTAGSILAGHTGGLLAGFGLGTVSAAGVAALLAVPGVNVGVAAGMLLVGAAGLAGGYLGGSAGETMFKDLYEEISALGIVGFSQQLYDDYKWGLISAHEAYEIGGLMGLFKSIFTTAQQTESPLVLDIAGTGINLTSVNSAPVYWDIDLDGMREASGWIGAGSGLLAIDLNSNGKIDDHAELFGNQNGGAANGFQALAVYDSNSDGVINANDNQFDDLLVWMDTNSNGLTDDGELFTLSDLNITSINLSYTTVNYALNDNIIRQESTFTINGQTHDIVDAWFAYDYTNTSYAGEYDLDVRALLLPTQRGYGNLPDLHISMSLNEDLLDMVAALSIKNPQDLFSSTHNVREAITDIMYEWAGVTNVDPSSRGSVFDAQKLEFLEKLYGAPLWNNDESVPGPAVAWSLREAWNKAFSMVATHLLSQAGLNDLLGNPVYDALADALSGGTFGEDLVLRFVSPFSGYDGSINGSDLNDVYVIQLGEAPTSLGLNIVETLGQGNDALLLGGVAANDVYFWTEYNGNFVVKFGGTDQVKILGTNDAQGAARPGAYVEQVMLDDGTTWDLTGGLYLRNDNTGRDLFGSSYGDTIIGGNGNDIIHAKGGDDTIIGSAGYDNLYGGQGDDLYIFGQDFSGGGYSTVIESSGQGADTIWFTDGILSDEIYIWTDFNGYFWMENQNDPSDNTVRINGSYVSGTGMVSHVEQVIFDDQTTWDMTDGLYLRNNNTGREFFGSAYDDTMIGGTGSDIIRAMGGDDTLIGGGGSDLLYGGLGADTFGFTLSSVGNGSSAIGDFSLAQGDRLDLRDLLSEYDPLTDALSDFVQFTNSGAWNSVLKVDLDSAGTTHSWTQIALIYGNTNLDPDTLVANGNLLAA